jgi:hypothetical protein
MRRDCGGRRGRRRRSAWHPTLTLTLTLALALALALTLALALALALALTLTLTPWAEEEVRMASYLYRTSRPLT